MKIPKPPRPPGPPIPPAPNVFFADFTTKMNSSAFTQDQDENNELLYNNFMHRHILNFYEYAMLSENDANKRVKCGFIDLKNIDYFYNDNKRHSNQSQTRTPTKITITRTSTKVSQPINQVFREMDFASKNQTNNQLKTIPISNNKKFLKNFKLFQIENQPIFKLMNTTDSNIYINSSNQFGTRMSMNSHANQHFYEFEQRNTTNFFLISKEHHENASSNINDLFDQIYSNQAILLYKMLLIPTAILVLVLILSCIAFMTKK